jgi:hypothetical protein
MPTDQMHQLQGKRILTHLVHYQHVVLTMGLRYIMETDTSLWLCSTKDSMYLTFPQNQLLALKIYC